MNILVTGGAGFIGSHVAEHFLRRGHRVTVVDDLSSGKRANLPRGARFVKADVRSPGLKHLFRRGRFDVLNHHAAQIDVRRSVADPSLDASVNIMGLLNLLELARAHRVRKVIFAASGGTYYGECPRPAAENRIPNPLSPYGVTKLAGEAYVKAYRALHGIDYAVLRYGNVYGPRQDPHGEAGVVAIFGERMLNDEPVFVFGNGRQQRDYVYVGDVARANVLALARGRAAVVNVGSGVSTSVNGLFARMKAITGYRRKPVHRPARAGELFHSALDIRRAAREIGWRPETLLDEGLRETVDFFRRERGAR